MNLLDQPTDDQIDIDENKDYLSELVGEGKKFKSPEELAKGKYIADQYVETLKRRLDVITNDYKQVRAESDTRAKLEDLINRLSNKNDSSSEQPPAKDEIKPVIDTKDIDSLISNKLEEREVSKRQSDNFNLVRSKLQERLGKNYQDVVKHQIDELGISVEDMNDMARNRPKVLLKALGVDEVPQSDPFQAPPRSSRISDNFKPNNQKRTWAYYQNLKKNNPDIYMDRKTAIQMHDDAIALGDAFQDGDFKLYGN